MLAFCDEGQAVRRKPSYYAVRRELAPFAIGMAKADEGEGLSIWVVAGPTTGGSARLCVRAFTLSGQRHDLVERNLELQPNQAQELGVMSFARHFEPLVYGAQLFLSGVQVARSVLWPQPLRELPFQDPGLQVERDGDRLRLGVARPAKGVYFSADGPLDFSDNLLDLLPQETFTVSAPGLAGRGLQVRSLLGDHGCY
jgi:beta-mannosidase